MAKSKRSILETVDEMFEVEIASDDNTVSILDVFPGQSIRGFKDNPVREIDTHHGMSCRGVHVNNRTCFDRIARVEIVHA